jgi:uncharacterized protein (TIGR03435 family)
VKEKKMSRPGTRSCHWIGACIVGTVLVLSGIANVALCLAKSQASQPQFDVASIKPSTVVKSGDNNPESIDIAPGGRLTMRNIRLSSCLKWAFDVQDSQVSGPGWIESERYDIIAQATGPTTINNLKLMLRSLLADRVRLELHHAKQEASVYRLVVEKNGPKFSKSKEDGKSDIRRTPVGVTAEKTSMAEFADLLSGQLGTPVADMTGLKGRYDLAFDLRRYVASQTAPQAISSLIVEAMDEQLGLKLQSVKTVVDTLVIDHIERPSAN